MLARRFLLLLAISLAGCGVSHARLASNVTTVAGPTFTRMPAKRSRYFEFSTVSLSDDHVLVRRAIPRDGVWLLDRIEQPMVRILGFDDVAGVIYLFDDEGNVVASRDVPKATHSHCAVTGAFVEDGRAAIVGSWCEDVESGPYRWEFASDEVTEFPGEHRASAFEPGLWGNERDEPEEASAELAPHRARLAERPRGTFYRPMWAARVGTRLFVATAAGIVEIARGRAELTRCRDSWTNLIVANGRGVRVFSPNGACDVDRGTLVEGFVAGTSEDGRFVFLANGDAYDLPPSVTYELVDLANDHALDLGALDLPAVGSPLDPWDVEGHVAYVGASGRYVAVVPDGQLLYEHEVVVVDVRTRRLERFEVPDSDGEGAMPRSVRVEDDVIIESERGSRVRVRLDRGTHEGPLAGAMPPSPPLRQFRGDALPVRIDGFEIELEDGTRLSLVEHASGFDVIERRGRVYALGGAAVLAERAPGIPTTAPTALQSVTPDP